MTRIATAPELARALTMLLRREVKVKPAVSAPAARLIIGGTYKDGNGKLLGSVAVDLGFAAHAGAALSMIPADVAREQIRAGALDEFLRENFAEVLNVLSRAFFADGDGRVTLEAAVFPPEPTSALTAAAQATGNFQAEISGYGEGLASLRLLA